MRYEWDPQKARENVRKHNVSFADAVSVLEDEFALTIEDHDHDELRFKTLGMGPENRVLLVVHALRRLDAIRIISVRRASKSQIQQYFEGLDHER